MTRTDRFGVEVRERVMWDIREGVVGADTFIPKHVTIITWKNMSFAGGIDISLFKVSETVRHNISHIISTTSYYERIQSSGHLTILYIFRIKYYI